MASHQPRSAMERGRHMPMRSFRLAAMRRDDAVHAEQAMLSSSKTYIWMVALLFEGIKGARFSCASSSSVAIRESIDRAKSIALPTAGRGSTRPKSQSAASKPVPTDGSVGPSSSSRYLLSSTALLSDDPSFLSSRGDEGESVSRPPISSARPHDQQVVVLRVSLHCKGREGKVRKHISKMEGVTSFSVDLATKKVTVVGDVMPSGVLDSISKVKNARFWSSPPQSSASSQSKEPY